MVWINLAQNWDLYRALVNTDINHWVPQIVGKFFSDTATGGFSRRTQVQGVCVVSCYTVSCTVIIDKRREVLVL
jgi:hypothetical protein